MSRPALLLIAGLASCGPGPAELGRCSGTIVMTVDQSNGLRFTWEPSDCLMYTFSVIEGPNTKWHILGSRAENRIASGIEYGVTPDGMSAQQPGLLFAGTSYRAVLTRIDESGTQVLAGAVDFIRSP